MSRNGWRLRTAGSGVAAALLLTGCPNGTSPLSGLEGGAPVTDEDVYKVLASAAKAFDASDDEAFDTADEPAFFGEDAEKYDLPGDPRVAVSEDSVAGDVANEDGDRPVVQGTVAGEFLTDDASATSDQSGGVYRGQWLNADGALDGHVRGEFRPFDAARLPPFIVGGGRFHGKLVNAAGRFRGRMRGLYGHTADGRTLFVGRWFDRHERLVGVLKGHWDDEAAGGGTFAGRWAAFDVCGESAALDDLPFAADDFGGLSDADLDLDAHAARPAAGGAAATEREDRDVSLDPDDTPLEREADLDLDKRGLCIDADEPHGFVRGWHRPHGAEAAAEARGDGAFQADWHSRGGERTGYIVGVYELRRAASDDAAEDGDDDDADDAIDDDGDDHGDDSGDDEADDPAADGDSSGRGGAARDGAGRGSRGTAGASAGSPRRTHGAFYGRWFDRDGAFGGYVRGVFGAGPHGLGVFRGKYFDAAGRPRGVLRGRWDDARAAEGGPMFGVWVGAGIDGRLNEDADGPDDSDADQ